MGTGFMKLKILVITCLLLSSSAFALEENKVTFEFYIPTLEVDVYHRPFVAAWIQSDATKENIPLAVWYDDEEWLKDLRQWWRRIGRGKSPNYDHVTGATKKPGKYRLSWDGKSSERVAMPSGEYWIYIEAAREEGDREVLRQKFYFGGEVNATLRKKGRYELGDLHIEVKVKGNKQ